MVLPSKNGKGGRGKGVEGVVCQGVIVMTDQECKLGKDGREDKWIAELLEFEYYREIWK